MIPRWLEPAADVAASLVSTRPAPPYSCAVLAGRSESATFAVFASGTDEPFAFLKVVPAPAAGQLAAEHEGLELAASIATIEGTAPRTTALLEAGDRTVLVQTGLSGTPLVATLRASGRRRRRATRSDIRRVEAWLRDLSRGSVDGVTTLSSSLEDHAEALARAAAGDHDRQRALDALITSADVAVELPTVTGHGDLWPGNVLLAGDRVGVVDWQHAHRHELPLTDLFFFLFTYAHARPVRGGWLTADAAFDRAFIEDSPLARECADAVHRALARLGLAATTAEPALLAFLVARAADDDGAPIGPKGTDWLALAGRLLDQRGRTALSGR
jgi:aminoglycoside phosphotransferase (APT) family kinase protein